MSYGLRTFVELHFQKSLAHNSFFDCLHLDYNPTYGCYNFQHAGWNRIVPSVTGQPSAWN